MKKLVFLTLSALMLLNVNSFAQEFDDVYFDPTGEDRFSEQAANVEAEPAIVEAAPDEDDYVSDDIDNYDYEYTSRIRRFNRPYTGFSYYGGCYVDRYYYDAYSPGTSIYIVNNRYNRWNRFNSFGHYDPYGYNSFANPYNPYNRWNNNYYNGYYNGYNNGYNNGWNNSYYYGNGFSNGYGSNNYFAASTPNSENYYYGARRTSASNASGSNSNPRALSRKKRGEADENGVRTVRGSETGSNTRVTRTAEESSTSPARTSRNATVNRNSRSATRNSSRNSESSRSATRSSSSSSSAGRSSSPSRSSSARSSSSSSRSSSAGRSSSPSRSSTRSSSSSSRSSKSPSRSNSSSSSSSKKSSSSRKGRGN